MALSEANQHQPSSSGSAPEETLEDPFSSMSAAASASTPAESTNLALVVMMGLPASGKSTVANQLAHSLSSKPKWQVVIVSFDDFVPLDRQIEMCMEAARLEAQQMNSNNKNDNSVDPERGVEESITVVKLVRTKFASCVDTIVRFAQDHLSSPSSDPGSPAVDHYLRRLEITLAEQKSCDRWKVQESFLVKTKTIVDKLARDKDKLEACSQNKTVIIVDDNNYYHSMRNTFYQIAKQYETGFCLVNCKAPLKTCVQRNSQRPSNSQVAPKAIVEMGLKYEEPNPLKNACDMYCVNVNTSGEVNFSMLEQVITSSFSNPPTREEDRSEEIERERRICSENEVHQADLVLRKWVSKKMSLSLVSQLSSKGSGGAGDPSNARKVLGREMNERKKKTLEKLKTGELQVSYEVSQDVEFRNEIIGLFEKLDLSATQS